MKNDSKQNELMEDRFKNTIDYVKENYDDSTFQAWFNSGANEKKIVGDVLDEGYHYKRGSLDFFHYIFPSEVYKILGEKNLGTALEIGYGGGRIVRACATVFDKVIGIDLHSQNKYLEGQFHSDGLKNVEFHQTSGKEFPVGDASLDFVYSFIVFLHLSSPDIFEEYVKESYRSLKKGGVASLFYARPFGNRSKFSKNSLKKFLLFNSESFRERIFIDLFGNGYVSNPSAMANTTALMISKNKIKTFCKSVGFKIVEQINYPHLLQGQIILKK